MRRYKIMIAYDGTNYCGWQIQPTDPTVEGTLNETISKLTGEDIAVIGASRTDSGVHALGNVAVFDSESPIDPERMADALNTRLPDDIIIQESCEVDKEFHPRYCDTIKTYEYTFYNAIQDNPITNRHHHYVYFPMDEKKMEEAAKDFVGVHSFHSLCSSKTEVKTFEREIYECSVKREGKYITMRVCGNGFLWNMVRMMAGTLLEIGRGKQEVTWVRDILSQEERVKAGPKLPAKGLTLVCIEYL